MNARYECSPFEWPATVCWIAEQASCYHWIALAGAVVFYIMAR